MTSDELQAVIKAGGVTTQNGILVDDEYDLPALDWFLNDQATALRTDLARFGAAQYEPNRNDCDKYALYGMALAKIEHNLSTTRDTGLAVGQIAYLDMQVGDQLPIGHSIMFAVVLDGGQHKLIFFEPQTQKQVQLLDDEIASIWYYYI